MKKNIILAAIIIVATAAILYGVRASRSVVEVYVAQRGSATSAVYGTVKICATMLLNVRARNSGVVQFSDELAQNPVVGREVKQGELLATILTPDLDREITKAETDLKAAEERQNIGPPSLPQLKTQEAQLDRLSKLAQLQNVPASDVERVRNDVQSLREHVRSEQLELDRFVAIMREQAGVLQDRKSRSLITSPLDGYLNAISCVNAEFISEGSTPFVVATKSVFIEGQINEEDVGRVLPKMKATVRLYSFANQDFSATVSQVLPSANNQRYSVMLMFDKVPPNLMAGMTGEMNIIAGKRENALLIPSRAVLVDRVWVVQNEIVRPRTVKVGFRNIERSEILDGLREGEQVVVADQDLLRTGQHVRAITINQ